MEIVEEYPGVDAGDDVSGRRGWLARLIDLNLVLLIVLIGVPVLVYCIVASSK